MLRRRAGHVLLELLLALAAGGIVVAAAVRLHVAQERATRALLADLRAEGRAREAAAILPVTLRALAPGEGDIPPGAATDTTLELRETIGSAVVCDVGSDFVVLPNDSDDGATLAAYLSRPDIGDSLWLLPVVDGDSAGGRWSAAAVVGVGSGACGPIGAREPPAGGVRLSLAADPRAAGIGTGSPARITRRARYSLYRAGDGAWYLGYRTFSPVLGRLATVQPISGPYASPSSAGAPFRYFAADGRQLAAPVAVPESIARVDVRLLPARGAREAPARDAASAQAVVVSAAARNR